MSQSGEHFRNRHGGTSGAGTGARTRDTHGAPGFSADVVGMSWGDARDGEQSYTGDQAPDSVDGGVIQPLAIDGTRHILPATLGMDLFASTIVPPRVLGVLPVLPDAAYPEGSLVFLTTDGKLHRNFLGAWTLAVDGVDIIADSITAGQIAAGAIGASEVATGSLNVGHHASAAGGNTVPNPGFEINTPTTGLNIAISGWAANDQAKAGVSAASRSGERAAVLESDGVSNKALATVNMPVEPGARYAIKFYVKGQIGNAAGCVARGRVDWRDRSGVSLASASFSTTIGADTTYRLVTTTRVSDVNAAYASFQLSFDAAGSVSGDRIYCDDVEFYRLDADINHAAGNVLINSAGVTISNGKITLNNAAGTVIIDGSSEMFRILQQGTLSRAQAASTQGTSFVDVSTVNPECPSHISFVSLNAPTALPRVRWPGIYLGTSVFPRYTATTSGGAVTSLILVPNVVARVVGFFDDPISTIDLVFTNYSPSTYTAYCRYYVLQKAAI